MARCPAAQRRRGRPRRRDRRRRRRRHGLFSVRCRRARGRDRGRADADHRACALARRRLIAAAGIRGSVAIIERNSRKLVRTLVGPGLPVWSAAFFPDNRTLLTGGTDRVIRRWDALTGEPIGDVVAGARRAIRSRLSPAIPAPRFSAPASPATRLRRDEGARAGPTLAGIFGRKIATLPGYDFSDALRKLDIVWSPATVAKLFELGPMAYTPGTKMPEQRIGSAQDRAALVRFLEKATQK